jgi:hypothetical protein
MQSASGTGLRCGILVALGLVLSGVTGGATRAADDNEDVLPKKLSCSFTSGASWSYEAGNFASKPPSPLTFTIADIDLEKQQATLKAAPDASPGKLSVVRAINANHFLEVVTEGFLNLTTVYDKDPSVGKYPAVHSRHFGLLGQPVFGQYTGFCSEE